jgi:hypothetical protein
MHYFIKSPDLVHGIIDPNPPEYYFSLFPRHFVYTTVHDLTILVHKFAAVRIPDNHVGFLSDFEGSDLIAATDATSRMFSSMSPKSTAKCVDKIEHIP